MTRHAGAVGIPFRVQKLVNGHGIRQIPVSVLMLPLNVLQQQAASIKHPGQEHYNRTNLVR